MTVSKRVQLLYFAGCPNHVGARELVERVAAESHARVRRALTRRFCQGRARAQSVSSACFLSVPVRIVTQQAPSWGARIARVLSALSPSRSPLIKARLRRQTKLG